MPKSKKSSKKSSKAESVPDVQFFSGNSSFKFPNGDSYEGEYCAHYTGLAWREGYGTYTTKDGQMYEGEWYNDKIVDNSVIKITYPNRHKFEGKILKNKYNGPGTYILENNLNLICNFSENKPVDDFVLLDSSGHPWQGKSSEKESIIYPEHIFFTNINSERGVGKSRIREPKLPEYEKSTENTLQEFPEEGSHLFDRDLEKQIFAKSTKTPSKLNFEKSPWYRNYVDFKQLHMEILTKIRNEGMGVLSDDELKWYTKYKNFKKEYAEIVNKSRVDPKASDIKLYELFHSEEFKNKVPILRVIYPTLTENSTESRTENIE